MRSRGGVAENARLQYRHVQVLVAVEITHLKAQEGGTGTRTMELGVSGYFKSLQMKAISRCPRHQSHREIEHAVVVSKIGQGGVGLP